MIANGTIVTDNNGTWTYNGALQRWEVDGPPIFITGSANNAVTANGSSISVGNSSINATMTPLAFSLNGTPIVNFGDAPSDGNLYGRKNALWSAVPVQVQNVVLLNTLTATNSVSLDDTVSITATYDQYMVELINLIPATNNDQLILRYQVSGTFQVTSYKGTAMVVVGTGQNFENGLTIGLYLSSSSASSLGIASAGQGVSGTVFLHSPNNTTRNKSISGTLSCDSTNAVTPAPVIVAGHYIGSTAAVTGLRFLYNAGNIASGIVKIYGIKT